MIHRVLRFIVCLGLCVTSARAADTITISLPASLAEGASGLGTVTLSSAPATSLAISLITTDPRISVPSTVTVPAGQTTVNFTVSYPENPFIEDSTVPASVTATGALGWTGSTAQVSLIDNEAHNLLILVPSITVTEGGSDGGFYIYSAAPVRSDLTITMQISNPAELTSSYLTTSIPAGLSRTDSPFSVSAVDDSARDGAHIVTVTATAPGMTSASIPVTVRDNDPAAIAWPALTGPLTAGTPVFIDLRALTVDGDPFALTGPITITATTNGQPVTVVPASLASIGATGTTKFWLPTKAGSTVLTATAGDVTGNSAPFTVQAAAHGSFEWSAITPPMQPGIARTLTLKATDAFGNAVTSFNGTADLLALSQSRTDQIGTGQFYQSPVLTQVNTRMRSQMLIRSSSLAGAGRIHSLALELLGTPTRPYDELTIRVKHTSQFFAPGSWDGGGWTVVRQGAWLPAGAGWVTIPFQVPFDYDGTSNLYVDVSFVNDAPGGAVFCQGTSVSGFFGYYFGTNDLSYGLPTTWTGNAVPANLDYRPNMRLGFGSVLSMTPATTTAFVNGVWSGDVTLTGAPPQHVVLRASSGSAVGQSDVFDLGLFPPAAPVMSAEPSVTPGTSNTVSWDAVASAGSYYVEASTAYDLSSNVISSGWIAGTSFNFTGLSHDGAWYFHVKARRADDTAIESEWSNIIYTVQDSTGPRLQVNGFPDGESANTLQTVRAVAHLSGQITDLYSTPLTLTMSGQAITVPETGLWSGDVTMPASGSVTVSLVATDSLGNQTTRTITITRIPDADGDGLPDAWQQSTGLSGAGLSAADAGPNGDPDHDGLTNMMEFALGTNPLAADASLLNLHRYQPDPFGFTTGWMTEFDCRISSDFIYEVHQSTDLIHWGTIRGALNSTPNADGITQHISVFQSDVDFVTFPPPPPPTRKFVRLVVTQRP